MGGAVRPAVLFLTGIFHVPVWFAPQPRCMSLSDENRKYFFLYQTGCNLWALSNSYGLCSLWKLGMTLAPKFVVTSL